MECLLVAITIVFVLIVIMGLIVSVLSELGFTDFPPLLILALAIIIFVVWFCNSIKKDIENREKIKKEIAERNMKRI